MFCVQVRRTGWVNVYIDCPDPVTARDMALKLISESEFETKQTTAAYPIARAPVDDRFWRGDLETGGWVYPATGLFERNEA